MEICSLMLGTTIAVAWRGVQQAVEWMGARSFEYSARASSLRRCVSIPPELL
jgi:hypothetical protein